MNRFFVGLNIVLDYLENVDSSFEEIKEYLYFNGFDMDEVFGSSIIFDSPPLYRVFSAYEKQNLAEEVRSYIQVLHLKGFMSIEKLDNIVQEALKSEFYIDLISIKHIIIKTIIDNLENKVEEALIQETEH